MPEKLSAETSLRYDHRGRNPSDVFPYYIVKPKTGIVLQNLD